MTRQPDETHVVDHLALNRSRLPGEGDTDLAIRLLKERDEARMITRGLFWGEIPPDRIEAVTRRVKGWLRLPPDAYLEWLEN